MIWESDDWMGRRVRLHVSVWRHVLEGHPEMAGSEEAVRATVASPTCVYEGHGRAAEVCCRLGCAPGHPNLYVCVPVTYRGKENRVQTAYLASTLPTTGTLLHVSQSA